MNTTTNYELYKPEGTDPYDIDNENHNMDVIDTTMKGLADDKLNKIGDSKDVVTTFTSSDVADGNASAWTPVTPVASLEKHSSIFAKMSQMFKNVRYLYKLLGTTDISSIGGGTVTGAISAFNTGKVDTVAGKGLSENDFTDTLKTKLDGIATGAEVNVQANWAETTPGSDAYIQNKPGVETASKGGSTQSLVSTGEKYSWNAALTNEAAPYSSMLSYSKGDYVLYEDGYTYRCKASSTITGISPENTLNWELVNLGNELSALNSALTAETFTLTAKVGSGTAYVCYDKASKTVSVRGYVSHTSDISTSTALFTMTAGYRPSTTVRGVAESITSSSAVAFGNAAIDSSGNIYQGGSSASRQVMIDIKYAI